MSPPVTNRFRPSAKGVVVVDDRVLVTRNQTPGEGGPDWHIFPGGGQRPGETLHGALVREVREETGIEVMPGRLLWVRELIIALRSEWPFDAHGSGDHALEFMFEATFVHDHGDAYEEDLYQTAVEWVTPDELAALRFYPAGLVPVLRTYVSSGESGLVYLGDID